MKPVIVVIAYNRHESLNRLLNSLLHASYKEPDPVDLIISIDYQPSEKHARTVEVAKNFRWPYGEKHLIEHASNLGLRRHVISCGDLVLDYDSIIMLEDDLYVSPYFYSYSKQTLEFYSADKRIGGISLYNHRLNFCNRKPFDLLAEVNYDVYFLQIASSWGQAWTKDQWIAFKTWYEGDNKITSTDNIPEAIRYWPESSWLKYYIKFLVATNKFFVYPKQSYSTNFGDAGTHNLENDTTFQVPLAMDNPATLRLGPIEDSINRYDAFFELIPSVLKMIKPSLFSEEVVVDLYGLKDLTQYEAKYAISRKKVQKKAISTFGLNLKPLVANVLFEIKGAYFNFSFKEDFVNRQDFDRLDNREWTYFWGKLHFAKILPVIYEKVKIRLAAILKKNK